MVSDNDGNRDAFRIILRRFMEGLPHSVLIPWEVFNRYQLALVNGSHLFFQVAGSRQKGSLGRSKGINYAHGTELSSWGDVEGFASLCSSFSNSYPGRLYIFESTARGCLNLFHDLWTDAAIAVSMRQIFIGWWAREDYRLKADSAEYRVYAGTPTAEEEQWMAMVKQMYGADIDAFQLAWWRWYAAEITRSKTVGLQEMPWFPDQAFIVLGERFFDAARLKNSIYLAKSMVPTRRMGYFFGSDFKLSKLVDVADGELAVWADWDPEGTYVMGVDPAHGAGGTSDFTSIEIWRGYADGLQQVAELRTRHYRTYQTAWAIAHLAGHYRARVNLELNGPGLPVWQEFLRLQMVIDSQPGGNDTLTDFLSGISHFYYHRDDSLGVGLAYHTKTTHEEKLSYMHGFQNAFERDLLTIRSEDLLGEMENIREEEDGTINGGTRGTDDSVIASGLAIKAWTKYELADLTAQGVTQEIPRRAREEVNNPQLRIVHEFLADRFGEED